MAQKRNQPIKGSAKKGQKGRANTANRSEVRQQTTHRQGHTK
jgi:hypothetical protein